MTQQSNRMAQLSAKYQELTPREQLLLKVMGAIAVVLSVAVVVSMVNQSVMELEEQTTLYGSALDTLAAEGPGFLAAGDDDSEGFSRADLFTDEILEDNPVQLTSYVASHASAVDVSVSSYDTDSQPLGSSGDDEGGRIITERQLRADIRNAEMGRFIELLHRLEESSEPVVIKRVDIRSVRDEGHVRALLIVSTFEYTEDRDS